MHFVSCSDSGGEGHAIGLSKLRQGQFSLDEGRQRRDRKAIGEPIASRIAYAQRLEFAKRLAEQA